MRMRARRMARWIGPALVGGILALAVGVSLFAWGDGHLPSVATAPEHSSHGADFRGEGQGFSAGNSVVLDTKGRLVVKAADGADYQLVTGLVRDSRSHAGLYAKLQVGPVAVWTEPRTGRFHATLPVGSHAIKCVADGYKVLQSEVVVAEGCSPVLDLMIDERALRTVTVRNDLGHALENAQVIELRPGAGGVYREVCVARTDSAGVVSLPVRAPAACILARADGFVSDVVSFFGDTVLTCGESSTCHVRLIPGAEADPIKELTLSPMRSVPMGRWIVEVQDGSMAIPRESFAVWLPGQVKPELARSNWCDGYELNAVVPAVDVRLNLPRHHIRVVDSASGVPLAAEVELEAVRQGSWQVTGRVRGSGVVPVDSIAAAFLSGEAEQVRLVVRSAGYYPVLLTQLPESAVALTRSQKLTQVVELFQGGQPFKGSLALRHEGRFVGLAGPSFLFDGRVLNGAVTVARRASVAVDVLGSAQMRAPLLARIPSHTSADASVRVDLPEAGSLEVRGARGCDLALRSEDGCVIRGSTQADGVATFDDLWPGHYRIGPALVVGHSASDNLTKDVHIVSGERQSVSGLEVWGESPAFDGEVQLLGQPGASCRGLWVLPWVGDAPLGDPSVLASALPVHSSGAFHVPRLGYRPNVLIVFSVVAGGKVLTVAEVPARERLIRLECARLELDVQGKKSASGMLMLTLPTSPRGESVLNHMLPLSSGKALDLGILPTSSSLVVMDAEGSRDLLVEPSKSVLHVQLGR